MKPIISFIIPYSERRYCFSDKRLVRLIEQLGKFKDCEIIVHTSGELFTATSKVLGQANHIYWLKSRHLYQDLNQDKAYSAGQARNVAAKIAKGEYLFFVDVDLILHTQLITQLVERVGNLRASGKKAFDMYPCIYMGQSISKIDTNNISDIFVSYLKGENQSTDGIALASSCLLVNRKWFNELGGFDEAFVGHGGEDLELIHRLCLHYPIAALPNDYADNIKSQHPADYTGFRRYMACYALPHLFESRYLLHQWHPRPLTHTYHKLRQQNDALLQQMIASSVMQPLEVKPTTLTANKNTDLDFDLIVAEQQHYRTWLAELQQSYGFNVDEYPGLFRWQQGIKLKRPLINKIRKLYLSPRLFFTDLFNKWRAN